MACLLFIQRDVIKGKTRLCLNLLVLLLLLNLEQQGAVDVWQDTTKGNGGADQGIELLVTTDGKLKMSGGDTLDLEVLGGVLRLRLVCFWRGNGIVEWGKKKVKHLLRPTRGLRQSGTREQL